MKQELLNLINQTDSIRKLAHAKDAYIHIEFALYDVEEFIKWKQRVKFQLQTIPKQDSFIADTLKLVSADYNGLTDKRLFEELAGALEAIKNNIDYYYDENSISDGFFTNKVFIVHGHDETVRDRVELFLRRVGLDPVILCNKPNGGLTIIEKIEEYKNAVQVYDQREKLIGYVPRYYAEAFAAFIKEKRVKKGKILCVDKNRNCDECIKIEVSVAGV